MKSFPTIRFRRWAAPLLLAPCVLLVSCSLLPEPQADPVRHFTLSGPAGALADSATVRPVQLAGHLRNRAMAVRVGENEVIYLDEVRWAEPLDAAITQLLRARIGPAAAGHVITIQIQRCELVRSADNRVQLSAGYTITTPQADTVVVTGSAYFTARPRTWDGRDYGELVELIRNAVNELGDAIVAALPAKN